MILRRRRRQPPDDLVLERQPDAHPKSALFVAPLRITDLEVLAPEEVDEGWRVTFRVSVRDAEDKRCPDIAVEAEVSGPDRTRTVQGTTDLLGRIRFRMAGPAGEYRLQVTDVGAGGLAWDPDAGPRTATVQAPST